MRILYHDDLDGKCAGFLVYDFLKKQGKVPELFPMNYGEPTPFDKGQSFWIVDFSVTPKDMRRLLDESPEVHWIDHHISAIEKYNGFQHGKWSEDKIYGRRQDGIAACELTWTHLHGQSRMPDFVRFIGDRDTWTWAYGKDTRNFCNGLLCYDTHPASQLWKDLVTDYECESANMEVGFSRHSAVRQKGMVISEYKAIQDVEYVNKNGIFVDWEGHECYIVNGMFSSEPFEKAVPNADIWITFRYMPGCYWNVGLYSKNVDVKEIAVKYGGGGHKGAAGFQPKELPFLPSEKNE